MPAQWVRGLRRACARRAGRPSGRTDAGAHRDDQDSQQRLVDDRRSSRQRWRWRRRISRPRRRRWVSDPDEGRRRPARSSWSCSPRCSCRSCSAAVHGSWGSATGRQDGGGRGRTASCTTDLEQIVCGATDDVQNYWKTNLPAFFGGAYDADQDGVLHRRRRHGLRAGDVADRARSTARSISSCTSTSGSCRHSSSS